MNPSGESQSQSLFVLIINPNQIVNKLTSNWEDFSLIVGPAGQADPIKIY